MPRTTPVTAEPSLGHELRALWRLAAPVVATQVGVTMLWVVDTAMLGAVSVEAVDAAALGRLWLLSTLMLAFGLLLGMDPYVAQAHGARDREALGLTLQRGIVLAVLASLPLTLLWLLTEPALRWLGQDPALSHEAWRYVAVQIPALPLLLVASALRQYLSGRGIMKTAMWITLAANGFNALGNGLFLFGWFGAPRLGAMGAGIATSVTQAATLVLYLVAIRRGRLLRAGWSPWSRRSFSPRGLTRILRTGAPIALQLALGTWSFQVTVAMSGWLGPQALAANTVVLVVVGAIFMVPLGCSIAAATRVGNLIGARRERAARRAAWTAIGAITVTMAGLALGIVLAGNRVPSWFSNEPAVILLAVGALPLVAGFQIADGVQVVGAGILRGLGRTRPVAAFGFVGHYVLALPIGWWLAFRTGLGLRGLWLGLWIGLTASALMHVAWLMRHPPRAPAR